MIGHVTPLADWVIVLPVVLALLGAAILLMLRGLLRVQAWGCALVLGLIFATDYALVSRVFTGGPLSMTMGRWLPPFGISFTADMLGAGFALVSAVVALVVVLYLQMDTPETANRDGVYPLILLLVGGVSGAFLTGDLFNLYVWFEVTLISSFGLFVLAGNPLQIDGTVKYAILNFLATTMFLVGLGLLYGLLGTLNMADIIGRAVTADAATLVGIVALFMLAFGIKAAAFPVNAWLPASYHTPPAGISALLAGLLTKVGAYALMRTLIFLFPGPLTTLGPVIYVVALATMIIGPLGAIAETGLRRALGFILIGGVGVILAGIALPSESAIAGIGLYVAHAIMTMTALYLAAGLIEKVTGAFDTTQMGGVLAGNALLSTLFLVLILGISGVPPFLGFWPKLLLLQGLFGDNTGAAVPDASSIVMVIGVLLNAFLTLIAGGRLWMRIFWRPAPNPLPVIVEPGRVFGIGALTLITGIIVIFGLQPRLPIEAAQLAAAGLLDPSRYIAAVGLAP